jgi:predicted ATPase/DNA-binding CsgD family transcriptional regulator
MSSLMRWLLMAACVGQRTRDIRGRHGFATDWLPKRLLTGHDGNVGVTAYPAGMSEREAEVLAAVGARLSNAQIAGRLHISVRTVESHVSSLLRKFGVADRRELAELASAVAAAPPAATAGAVAGLPAVRTSFIGREAVLAAVLAALAGARLVSLTGPGGVGKTRLAERVAEAAAPAYPFGAGFVDLVPVREDFVAQAVAAVLGVTERPGQPLETVVREHLARGRSLLVFDNCEHLLEAAAGFVERLLASCPGLTVLATTRERLAVTGERVLPVGPMSLVAAETGGTAGSEAELLFLDRARAADPGFAADPAAVGELCARLDGMPLAIELAAARSASLGAEGLLAGLDDHLRLLAGGRGGDERHRSLRAVINWSHDLLDEPERVLFRQLGVFAGGFDLDAAAAVADADRAAVADLIGRLADKSLLVRRRGADASRWQMLATIRAFALDKLAAVGEEAPVRERHLRWAAATAADLERQLEAGQPWREGFDTVADDLRVALASSSAGPGPDGVTRRLARGLGHLAYARRFLVEARGHYEAAATHAAGPAESAADLRAAADTGIAEGRGDVAFGLLRQSADCAASAGDGAVRSAALAYAATIARRFAATFPEPVPDDRIRQLVDEAARAAPADDPAVAAQLAVARAWVGEAMAGQQQAADGLVAARRTGDPVLISGALDAAVSAAERVGRLREAHRLNSERARLLSRMPRHDPHCGHEIVDIFHMMTGIAVAVGALPDALVAGLAIGEDDIAGGWPPMTASKPVVPLVLAGRFDEAFAYAERMWQAWLRAGQPAANWMAPATYFLVLAHGLHGDEDGRNRWKDRFAELTAVNRSPRTTPRVAEVIAFADARVALHAGDAGAALTAVADVIGESRAWYDGPHWDFGAYTWAVAAEAAVIAGLPSAEGRLTAAQPAGRENDWAAACLARARGRLHGDRGALAESVTGWERIGARFERACTLLLLADRAAEGRTELAALGCRTVDMA